MQKCFEFGLFCALWLRYVLRATAVCTFWTCQLPKVVWLWCVLYILTWKCASRRTGVHLSSPTWPDGSAPAALASLLFDFSEPQINRKTHWIATFLPFPAPASSFFGLFLLTRLSGSFSSLTFSLLFSDLLLSSLLFSSLLFSSLTLPTSAFPSVNIVGSLTSKLPSATNNKQLKEVLVVKTLMNWLICKTAKYIVANKENPGLFIWRSLPHRETMTWIFWVPGFRPSVQTSWCCECMLLTAFIRIVLRLFWTCSLYNRILSKFLDGWGLPKNGVPKKKRCFVNIFGIFLLCNCSFCGHP